MKSNVGLTDNMVRIITGLLVAGVGLYFKNWWGLLAIVPLLTGLFSFCPIYRILGLNTSSTQGVQ